VTRFFQTREVAKHAEAIRDRWLQLGQHLAPHVVEFAQRNTRRPEDLSVLIPREVWQQIRESVQ